MKKVIMIVIAMVFAVNNAQAMTGAEIVDYIRDTVPGISQQEVRFCADAWQNGGHFMVQSFDVTLTCEKNHIVKDWDLSKN
jgi:hypothetical protein